LPLKKLVRMVDAKKEYNFITLEDNLPHEGGEEPRRYKIPRIF